MPTKTPHAARRPIYLQLGLFGDHAEVAGMHVVQAHTRVLQDGSEVFVGEHVRWNRGRQASVPGPSRKKAPVPDDHPSLFDFAADPAEAPTESEPDPDEVPTEPGPWMEEVEVFPGAHQLPLWKAPG